MRFLIFIILCATTQGADYSGKIRINNDVVGSLRIFSGTVYAVDETNYYVVSCAHGIDDLSEDKRILSATLFGESETIVPLIVLIEDIDRDLSIMILQNTSEINIDIFPLADSVEVGTVCDTEGFSPNLTKRRVTVISNTKISSMNGEKMVQCRGNVEQGMSGCGLIYDNKICGVLSGKDGAEGTCVFASLFQIRTVMGKIK
jgi:hypothetical protein